MSSLKNVLALLGCSVEVKEIRRFHGVRYQHELLRLFGFVVRDRWRDVGWSDGTEDVLFPRTIGRDKNVSDESGKCGDGISCP